MASSSPIRIEPLNKENYDTWKIQMQTVLIKSEAWDYVNGRKVKPKETTENASNEIDEQ